MSKKRPIKKLTPQAEQFILEYVKCPIGAVAARRAGYEEKNARHTAFELLTNPYILEEIEKRRDALKRKFNVDQEKIIQELCNIAFADMGEFAEWDESGVRVASSEELFDGRRKALKKVKETNTEHGTNIEVELNDKIAAIRELREILGIGNGSPGENGPHSSTVTELLNRLRETKNKK